MEKEMIKNRQATELALIKAVDDIIEEAVSKDWESMPWQPKPE